MEIASLSAAVVQNVLQGLQSVVGVARARNTMMLQDVQVKDFEEKLQKLKRVIADIERVKPPSFTAQEAFDKLKIGVATASADAYIQKALVALKHAQQQGNANLFVAALKEAVKPSALAKLLDYWNDKLDALALEAGEVAGVSFSEGVSGIIRARNLMKVQDLKVKDFHEKLMKLKERIIERENFQPMRFVSLEAETTFWDLKKGLEAANSDIDVQKAFACSVQNTNSSVDDIPSAIDSLLDYWNIRLDGLASDAEARRSFLRQRTVSSYCKRSMFYLRHEGHYKSLQASLNDDSKKVVVISGMVGTGKSCLALDAGISQDEEGEQFSGGVYLLDFSNLPTNNPCVLRKQRDLLRHLGFALDSIASVHAGTEAIENALSNGYSRLHLVILDNIQDASVLKMFVFPQFDNIKILLTTQNNELISAATSLGVSSEIIQLLPRRSGFDEKLLLKYIPKLQFLRDELQDIASQILHLCDGCFQAIAILGSALNKVEDSTVGWMQVLNDFCYYLKKDCHGDKGSLFAAIETTKKRLGANSVTCLTMMGLFAPSTNIPQHVVRLACDSNAVQGYQVAMEELVETNLLLKYVETDPITRLQMVFYQVHTIVGEYIKTSGRSSGWPLQQKITKDIFAAPMATSTKQEIFAALTDLITVTGELKSLVRDCRYTKEEVAGWLRRHGESLQKCRYSKCTTSSLESTDVTEVREYLGYFIDSLLGYLKGVHMEWSKHSSWGYLLRRQQDLSHDAWYFAKAPSVLKINNNYKIGRRSHDAWYFAKAPSVLKVNNNYKIGRRLQMLETLKELLSLEMVAKGDCVTRLSVLLMTFGRREIAWDAARRLGYVDSWVPEVTLEWQWEDQLASVQKLLVKTLSTWAWAKGIKGEDEQAKKDFDEALVNDPDNFHLAMVHEAAAGAAAQAAQDLHKKILESQQAIVEHESIHPLRFASVSAERAFYEFKEGLNHATNELNAAVVDQPEIMAALRREPSTQENNPIWLKASLLKGLEAVQVDTVLESKVRHWRQQLHALQSEAELEGCFRKEQPVPCYLRHDKYFNRLKTLLSDKDHRVVVVSGMLGAGKSCLALDAALELDDGEQFPGGVVILDFHNRKEISDQRLSELYWRSEPSFDSCELDWLLVLDNVSMDVIGEFLQPAKFEHVKVLVTTRSSGAPYASVEIIPQRSDFDEKLLLNYVTKLHSIPSNLMDVTESLLTRCNGCFQAIGLLGLVLNQIRPELSEWTHVLENFIDCLEASVGKSSSIGNIFESVEIATKALSSPGFAVLRNLALSRATIPEQVVSNHPDSKLKELLAANLVIKHVYNDPPTGKTLVDYQVHTIIADYIGRMLMM